MPKDKEKFVSNEDDVLVREATDEEKQKAEAQVRRANGEESDDEEE